jgi:hypothetical protein
MDMFIKIKISSSLEEHSTSCRINMGGLIRGKLKIRAFMNNNYG